MQLGVNPCRTQNKKVPAPGTFFNIQLNKLFFYLYVTGADNMYSKKI